MCVPPPFALPDVPPFSVVCQRIVLEADKEQLAFIALFLVVPASKR